MEFNRKVLDAIQECRAKDLDFIAEDELFADDTMILLLILLRAYNPACQITLADCKQYLRQHKSFIGKLNTAYLSQEFARILEGPEMPLDRARTVVSELTSSSSNPNLKSAFEVPYVGNTGRLFVDTLNQMRLSLAGATAANRPYNWSIAVVQSSGMGKSRMVDEASTFVLTIPINIREALPSYKKTYPPPDVVVQQFFQGCKNDSDHEQQKKYTIFLEVLFTQTLEAVTAIFKELTGDPEKLANAWATHLKAGQNEDAVGSNTQTFYDKVVQQANQEPTKEHERSPYHNLGTVLSNLEQRRVFFIFLSTNSLIEGFAPPASSYPSDRVSLGAALVPPFTEMPFDLHRYKVLRDAVPLTLENVCKAKVMVGFGRPLWYAQRQIKPHKNIFTFAGDKLTASGMAEHKAGSILATLGVRVGITFDKTEHTSYSTQSKLVNTHLRVVYSMLPHREYMHTGSPSEPVLAEAASRYLNGPECRGTSIEGPERLYAELKKGLLARGERGELAGRLLLTCAHDLAVARNFDPHDPEPVYHCPILVEDFLCALFHPSYHELILNAIPVNENEPTETLRTAFFDCYVSFSHFALAEDPKMLSAPALATALLRGMAIQARDTQASIDAVIPIHKAPKTSPISPRTTSAINLQFKNRKNAVDFHIDRSITVPDANMPVISIIFEFGVTQNQSSPISIVSKPERITPSQSNSPHCDDHHYQIIAYGCTSTVFGAIRPTKEGKYEALYEALLGTKPIIDDFPRKDHQENMKALLVMKPIFSGEREIAEHSELWKTAAESDTISE
ncbi:hypothetical protein OPQ81_006067 [Rhizoctonia solani]|nr:hypothetical protein OPQ81_006067 [Rhizoctonia solani]